MKVEDELDEVKQVAIGTETGVPVQYELLKNWMESEDVHPVARETKV